ncbi:MAG: hypothetical protein H6Q89_3412, partial [Myxococcaceae bacterium]|nr:hypothetical protein [Myxococcaceae bacterium]
MRSAALVLVLLAPCAWADELADWAAWEEAYQFDCNAPFGGVARPETKSLGGFGYEFAGGTVKVRRETPRHDKTTAKIGVLAGIKDLEPETKDALLKVLAQFEAADVELVLIGGDTAEAPDVLDQIYGFLVEATKRPLLTIAGNTERGGAHNYAIGKLRKAGHLHLINMGLTRRYDGEGVDVVSLSGYHDKRYLHLTGGCLYTEKAIADTAAAARASDDPVVLLMHGPPKQTGGRAIDYVPQVGNVGDPAINALIKEAKIPFGVFGHILEAGGTATDLAGKVLPAKKPARALYLNQGSVNPLPWKMNDGTTSYGMA